MNPRDPQAHAPEEIVEAVLVVNGSLGMNAGKIASQAFQAARLMLRTLEQDGSPQIRELLERWERDGTRTICRVAETAAVFDRVCREASGVVFVDEGVYGCEPDSPTVFAAFPHRRSERPQVLSHKRVQLYREPAAA